MPQLDLKTVVVVGLAIEVVCNLVMAALWRQGRRQYAGLGFWALNFAAQTTGLFLILLRGQLPIWLSVSAANVLLVGGAWLGLLGLERFVGRRRPQLANGTVTAAAVALHAYLTYVQPNLALRAAGSSIAASSLR